MENRKILILLSLITLLGFILRFTNVNYNPFGFFCDEASIGYNAYSLLKTGKDDSGASWPLFFKSFGEYKNPIQIYSTIPFIFIFGLNELSTRLPSVLFGTLSIIAIYFLVKSLFEKNIALVSALLLSISPWHIHLSRISPEGLTPLVFFLILGTFFFIKSRANPKYLLLSTYLYALSVYSYFAARIFTPLFVVGLIVSFHKEIKKKMKKINVVSFVLFMLLLLPIFTHTLSGPGLARWRQVSNLENKSKMESFKQASLNYLNYFSYDFLFTKGDADFPGRLIKRYSISGIGELFLFQLPLIVVGVLSLIKKGGSSLKIVSIWLLLYPIPGSITKDLTPYATRGITGVIPFQIISAVGLISIFRYFKKFKKIKTLLIMGVVVIILLQFGNFISLLKKYPKISSGYWGWQAGPREIMNYFLDNKNSYDEMYLEGKFNAPGIFSKFYDPENLCKNKCKIGYLENYKPDKKQLFALSAESYKEISPNLIFDIKTIVKYPSGEDAFYIGEIKEFK